MPASTLIAGFRGPHACRALFAALEVSLPSSARRCVHAAQVQLLQTKLQQFEAEAEARRRQDVQTVQQRECALAERDAAVSDADKLRADLNEAVAAKERLATALDWVADGVRHDRRTARDKDDKFEKEVRQWGVPDVFTSDCIAANQLQF